MRDEFDVITAMALPSRDLPWHWEYARDSCAWNANNPVIKECGSQLGASVQFSRDSHVVGQSSGPSLCVWKNEEPYRKELTLRTERTEGHVLLSRSVIDLFTLKYYKCIHCLVRFFSPPVSRCFFFVLLCSFSFVLFCFVVPSAFCSFKQRFWLWLILSPAD